MTTVENFPFLSQDEFKHVCDAFCSSVAPKERVDEDWKSIDVAERVRTISPMLRRVN